MQPVAIVVLLDEGGDVHTPVIQISIRVGVDLFLLERLHEALTTRVVIGIGWPTHTRNDAVRPQQGHILLGRILDAAIGMVDQPGDGCRSARACFSAAIGNRAASVRSSAQPTTLREYASSTTAR